MKNAKQIRKKTFINYIDPGHATADSTLYNYLLLITHHFIMFMSCTIYLLVIAHYFIDFLLLIAHYNYIYS